LELGKVRAQYIISGRIKVVMDDGTEEEFGHGDTAVIPPGRNVWIIGDESVVGIDFTGLKSTLKLQAAKKPIYFNIPIFFIFDVKLKDLFHEILNAITG
jgi:hypothetical protein